jgi:hypothetical protein
MLGLVEWGCSSPEASSRAGDCVPPPETLPSPAFTSQVLFPNMSLCSYSEVETTRDMSNYALPSSNPSSYAVVAITAQVAVSLIGFSIMFVSAIAVFLALVQGVQT